MRGLEGTLPLARLALRRDRVRLPVWLLSISGVTFFAGSSMASAFPTQQSIEAYGATAAKSAALIAMSGPPLGLDTLPGIVLNKIEGLTVIGVALMAAFEAIRHSRTEEEEGRTELLRAGVVGRHAGGAAALLVSSGAALLLGVLVALALAGASVPGSSALLYGASTAALGLVFAALALCLAQLFTHARAALGATLGLLGLAYLLRAAGDVRGDFLVWLTPVGWSQATHVLGRERWWPLLVCLAAWALLAAAAAGLSSARDVGSGLIAPREGAPEAGALLSGPVGLAVRLQRASFLGWAVGVFLMAFAFGSLTNAVDQMARNNPTLETYLKASGQGGMVDAFLATMLLFIALVVSGFAISSALRLHSEETSGRLESLLATGLSRGRWLAAGLLVTLVGSLLLLLAGGFGIGLSYGLVSGDPGQALRLAGLALVYAPALLTLAALAVLLDGWRPAWVAVAWAALGVCYVLGWLGTLLNLPEWVIRLSPFAHVPRVPGEAVTLAGPTYTLLAVALLTLAGWAGFRRRDIG